MLQSVLHGSQELLLVVLHGHWRGEEILLTASCLFVQRVRSFLGGDARLRSWKVVVQDVWDPGEGALFGFWISPMDLLGAEDGQHGRPC